MGCSKMGVLGGRVGRGMKGSVKRLSVCEEIPKSWKGHTFPEESQQKQVLLPSLVTSRPAPVPFVYTSSEMCDVAETLDL